MAVLGPVSELLFLDVDGVLAGLHETTMDQEVPVDVISRLASCMQKEDPNQDLSALEGWITKDFQRLDRQCISYLNALLVCRPNLKIVISSAWNCRPHFINAELFAQAGFMFPERIIGSTSTAGTRCDSLERWLVDNDFTGAVAVLTDDGVLPAMERYMVKCSGYLGMETPHIQQVIDTLQSHYSGESKVFSELASHLTPQVYSFITKDGYRVSLECERFRQDQKGTGMAPSWSWKVEEVEMYTASYGAYLPRRNSNTHEALTKRELGKGASPSRMGAIRLAEICLVNVRGEQP